MPGMAVPITGMHGPIGADWEIDEKDVTLAVALALASAAGRGVDVLMTRTTDTLIALNDRGRIANAKNGDVFLSIHVNAANPNWKQPGAARGFETYFLVRSQDRGCAARGGDGKRVGEVRDRAQRRRRTIRSASSCTTWRRTSTCANRASSRRRCSARSRRSIPVRTAA